MSRLATFLAAAHRRIAAGAYAPTGPVLRSNGSLVATVRGRPTILAELKPRSPSEGALLARPVPDLLQAYRDGGADALSILTDADHFGGSPDLLRQAHATGLPLLMKDFLVSEAQLDCARHNGASAVLLIERALDPDQRESLVAAAHERGVEVLLEVFDAKDWATARTSKADLIGVNARDLDTLQVDVAAATILLGQVAQERPGLAIALSGIGDRAAARTAFAAGARGILVGTALLKASDPALLLRSLRRPLAKTCGLRTVADVEAASSAGADLAGFVVLSSDSPRDLPVTQAAALAQLARGKGLRPVLVTRSQDLAAVAAACSEVRPDYVQLHGTAPPSWIADRASAGTQVLLGIGPGAAPAPSPGAVLDGTAAGGAGRTHDWSASRAQTQARASHLTLIAGGLDAGNAAQAVRESAAWGADASSGLESAPGRKDAARIRRFVEAVHAG